MRWSSVAVSSPSLRSSLAAATVAIRWRSKTPSESRKAFGMGTSQRLARPAVVWAITVKTFSSASVLGGGVRIRQGRTFAASPKSVSQTHRDLERARSASCLSRSANVESAASCKNNRSSFSSSSRRRCRSVERSCGVSLGSSSIISATLIRTKLSFL